MIIDCPVCKKPCKNLTSHMRASHPDYNGNPGFGAQTPESPEPPKESPDMAEEPISRPPESPDYSEVITGLLKQIEEQGKVTAALSQRLAGLEELAQSTVQIFQKLPGQVDLMVQQRLEQASAGALIPTEQQPQSPGARSSRIAEIAAIAQVLGPLLGGQSPQQPNMQALTAQFAAFKQVADLFQAPYSNGVRDTLNMITTAYKVGVPVENLSEAFKKMSGAEEKKSE